VGVVVGGVFNSGVLADPDTHALYDYAPAQADVVARARELRERAAARDVQLPAVALQFALRNPAVTTVLVGARTPAEVAVDVSYTSPPVPEALWAELDADV
jgi:D-threo-aldose 1-dehydrogenase